MTGKTTIFTYEIVGVRPNGFSHFCSPNGRIDGRNESYALSHTMRSFGFFIMDVTPVELIGQKFNKLTITDLLPKEKDKPRRCIAICDCGKIKEYQIKHVKFGRTVSCGCIYGHNRKSHGMSGTPLAKLFKNMKNRCYNPKCDEYHNYGGRGITIHESWLKDRGLFFSWALDHGYNETLQIDRENVNGNYSPDNCRFVKPIVNANNRRNNFYVTSGGITKTVSEWCRGNVVNKNPNNVAARLRGGWTLDEALSTPVVVQGKFITYNGETRSVTEWARTSGVKIDTFHHRLKSGWSIERAMNTPTNGS